MILKVAVFTGVSTGVADVTRHSAEVSVTPAAAGSPALPISDATSLQSHMVDPGTGWTRSTEGLTGDPVKTDYRQYIAVAEWGNEDGRGLLVETSRLSDKGASDSQAALVGVEKIAGEHTLADGATAGSTGTGDTYAAAAVLAKGKYEVAVTLYPATGDALPSDADLTAFVDRQMAALQS